MLRITVLDLVRPAAPEAEEGRGNEEEAGK